MLRPDGNIIWFGAGPHNDIYNVANGTWTTGADFTRRSGDLHPEKQSAILLTARNATGDARSHDFSSVGVWTIGTTSAAFDIPESCESGASTIQVVVNGLASTGTSVTLK